MPVVEHFEIIHPKSYIVPQMHANGFKINGCGFDEGMVEKPWRARAPNLFQLLDHETAV